MCLIFALGSVLDNMIQYHPCCTVNTKKYQVEGEGGGEDEGGEGDAVGHQDEGEEPPSAWTHSPKLISCT